MEREQTTIRLPRKLKEELIQEAQKMGISFNEFVMILLNRHQFHHACVQTRQRAE